ncbi:MAG: primosomal protein N', partial [Phycisphaerales bacterium JB041]
VERGIERSGLLRDWDALTYLEEAAAGVPPVERGELVVVPLGKGDTPTRGFVVETGGPELAEDIDPQTVKAILSRTGARVPPPLVDLGAWLSEYYVCPLGMAMATMVPAAVKAGTGSKRVRLLRRTEPVPELPDLTPKVREAWEKIAALATDTFPLAPRALADAIGTRTVREINRLVALGGLEQIERDVVRAHGETPHLPAPEAAPEPLTLTEHQRLAVEGLDRALGSFSAHLLYGVTGSGKTEVYIRLIERVLEAGKSAIVLVPEISLTPQTGARFVARFASAGVAVLHSGLTASERHREWKRAASGGARVVVGARSAVFAPLRDVGLIIVDEEHDTSYKQDQLPRYNARDVAVVRAQTEGCPALLGSATPSLEAWSNASGPKPRWALWKLPHRATGAVMPRVEIIDMAELGRPEPGKAPPSPERVPQLSPRLRSALRQTLDRGEQAIILLNRRGYSHYLCCRDRRCGWILECDQCDSRLVIHTGRDLPRGAVVRCHHCLSEQIVPGRCPACDGQLLRLGAGTQRVEEELTRVFAPDRVGPGAALVEGETLVRIDGDTMRSGRDFFRALSEFASGRSRVLLGTQMLAKGHDFPNVSLVGVLCADAALAMPDFRAAERTFQLVSQVAGRAGRGAAAGTVIVQAYDPGAPAVQLASAHDYEAFAEAELHERREAALPPSRRMARVVCRDREFEKARDAAERIAGQLRAAVSDPRSEVLGPAPCAIARIGGYYRFENLLLAPTARMAQDALQSLRRRGLLRSDARTAVDVDPVSLM